MRSINILTIDEKPEDDADLIKIVEEAKGYFPAETWEEIRYLGKLSLKHDVKILVGKQHLGGFLFEKLIERFGKIIGYLGLGNLFLGITTDPIVASYYFFDGKQFKRTVYLVHDYVTQKVGVVSLYYVNEKSSRKVVAHGLGHNRGLHHHVKPVDLMHPELLKFPRLQVEGFCKVCLRELMKDKNLW